MNFILLINIHLKFYFIQVLVGFNPDWLLRGGGEGCPQSHCLYSPHAQVGGGDGDHCGGDDDDDGDDDDFCVEQKLLKYDVWMMMVDLPEDEDDSNVAHCNGDVDHCNGDVDHCNGNVAHCIVMVMLIIVSSTYRSHIRSRARGIVSPDVCPLMEISVEFS